MKFASPLSHFTGNLPILYCKRPLSPCWPLEKQRKKTLNDGQLSQILTFSNWTNSGTNPTKLFQGNQIKFASRSQFTENLPILYCNNFYYWHFELNKFRYKPDKASEGYQLKFTYLSSIAQTKELNLTHSCWKILEIQTPQSFWRLQQREENQKNPKWCTILSNTDILKLEKNWGTKPYKDSPSEGYPHKILYPPPQKVNRKIQRFTLWPSTTKEKNFGPTLSLQVAANTKVSPIQSSFFKITISHKVCSPRERPVRGELSPTNSNV